MQLPEIIEELRQSQRKPTHRAVYDMSELLHNHRTMLVKQIDAEQLDGFLSVLNSLAETNPGNYKSEAFAREAERTFHGLRYLLERVI